MTSCDMYLFLQYPFLYHLSSIFYRSDNSRFVKKHLPAYHKEKGVFYACSSFYPALNLFTSCRYRQNTGRYRKSCTGVLVQVEVFHLPDQNTPGISGFFGMHIHDGDLPPLLSNRKYAWTAFYDTPFGISGIVGR